MKALVTGAAGMLGSDLCPLLLKNGYEVLATDINGNIDGMELLDIRDYISVERICELKNPDIVFHLAAETDVDRCELNQEHAFKVNTLGTENVAKACKKSGATLVYISTGAVFDGEKDEGYTEEDLPNPISVYGKSKLQGERFVSSLLDKYFIVRAGWMIGGYSKDKKFVWKIIELLKNRKDLQVVIDKKGSPTFTKDFAQGIIEIVKSNKFGLYHCVNKGFCTRFDVAKKIVEFLNRKDVIVKPVTSEVFPLPAPRGKSEAMLNRKMSLLGIDKMRPWQEALKEYLKDLG